MLTIQCPTYGESDDLHGRRDGRDITITCQQCGASWPRQTNDG